MALSLYSHCSWEYLPGKDDSYITHILHILSFLETIWILLNHFQGQTANTYLKHYFNSRTWQKKWSWQLFFFSFTIKKTKQNPVPCSLYYAYLSLTSRYNNTTATVSDFHSSVWVKSCLSEEHIFTEPLVISAFSIRCLPECGSLFCNPETVQSQWTLVHCVMEECYVPNIHLCEAGCCLSL